jgi:hypothetical protein
MDNVQVTDYGMFTDAGNGAVEGIVQGAISNDLYWDEVVDCLRALSNRDGFAEAMDTVVRENVYCAIFRSNDDYDGQPDEAQEWHDFDPDC